MMKRLFNFPQIWRLAVAMALVTALSAPALAAGLLDLKPLPQRKLSRLSEKAREAYDEAWAQIDIINYPQALKKFQMAVKADPDNVYLRELVAKLAQYLGDLASQKESQDYYNIAIENLSVISKSDQINPNQRRKVEAVLKLVTDLRNSVYERDEMRKRHGYAYAQAVSAEKAEMEKKREERKAEAAKKAAEKDAEKGGGGSTSGVPGGGMR